MDAGNIIRKLRVQNGYTQQHVADLLSVSRNAYMAWENNQVELTIRRLRSLCDVYSISLQEFFQTDEMSPPADETQPATPVFSFKDQLVDKLVLLKEQNSRLIKMNNKLTRVIRAVVNEGASYDLSMDKF